MMESGSNVSCWAVEVELPRNAEINWLRRLVREVGPDGLVLLEEAPAGSEEEAWVW